MEKLEPEIVEAFRHDLLERLTKLLESEEVAEREINSVWCRNVIAEASGNDLCCLMSIFSQWWMDKQMGAGRIVRLTSMTEVRVRRKHGRDDR